MIDVAVTACDMKDIVMIMETNTTTLFMLLLVARSLQMRLPSSANHRKDIKPMEAKINTVLIVNTPAWNVPRRPMKDYNQGSAPIHVLRSIGNKPSCVMGDETKLPSQEAHHLAQRYSTLTSVRQHSVEGEAPDCSIEKFDQSYHHMIEVETCWLQVLLKYTCLIKGGKDQ